MRMTTHNIMNSYGKGTVKNADQPRRCAMQLPSLSVLITRHARGFVVLFFSRLGRPEDFRSFPQAFRATSKCLSEEFLNQMNHL